MPNFSNKNALFYKLEADEGLADLLHFIEKTSFNKAFVEVSSNGEFLKNLLNLKLLKNKCEELGKEIIFISQDQSLRGFLKRAGFDISEEPSSFDERKEEEYALEDFQSSQIRKDRAFLKMYDILPPKEITLAPEEAPQEIQQEFPEDVFEKEPSWEEAPEKEVVEEAVEEPFPVSPKEPSPAFQAPRIELKKIFSKLPLARLNLAKIFFILGAFLLVFAGLFLYFNLSKAKVLITPKEEKIKYELTLTSEVDLSEVKPKEYKIPGEILTDEQNISSDFLSRGKETKEERARGTITVYNTYSSSPQTLVEKTRFVSSEGKLFRLAKTTVIPGAEIEEGKIIPSSIDVEVIAAEPGEGYNIGPSTFSIPGFMGSPKYTAFYGKSKTPMTGGFIGETEVITEEDFKKAQEEIQQKVLTKAREEFNKKLPENFIILDKAKEEKITKVESDKKVGDSARSFNMRATAQIRAFIFSQSDVEKLLDELLEPQLGEEKYTQKDSRVINHKDIQINFEKQKMTIALEVEEKISWEIDEEFIKKNLVGKREEEVKQFLKSQESIFDARVTLSPFWASKLPSNSERITIEIKLDSN